MGTLRNILENILQYAFSTYSQTFLCNFVLRPTKRECASLLIYQLTYNYLHIAFFPQ